jgi:DHA2 family multidrug resistance protein
MAAAAPLLNPAAPPHLASRRNFFGFLVMALGMFMAILDIQIVASSIAEIGAGLNASPQEVSWVQTSYLIAEVVMIPLSGWLARLLSTRWLFTISAVGFTLASLVCGLAWNLESMIVFRAVQGFIGGAMIPTVFATSMTIFRGRSQGRSVILIGLIVTLAPTLGPTLGGWITHAMSWHWIFFINVVPGLAIAMLVPILIDVDRPEPGLLKRIDGLGLLFVAAFLGGLQFVLEEGPRRDWFADQAVSIMAVVSAASGLLFLWRGLFHPNRMIDLRAFGNRNFAVGCLYSFIIGIGLYGSVFLIPQFFSQVRHYDSLTIGYIMMVVGIAQFVSAPIAGVILNRVDSRLMLAVGLALFGYSTYLAGQVTSNQTGFNEILWPQALRGFSLMFCFLPINMLALAQFEAVQLKNASGLYNLTRNLGGAIGLALINTIVQNRATLHYERLAESMSAADSATRLALNRMTAHFSNTLGDQAAEQAALKLLDGLVTREALVLSFADAFYLMTGVFVVSLVLMPLVRRVRLGNRPGEAH